MGVDVAVAVGVNVATVVWVDVAITVAVLEDSGDGVRLEGTLQANTVAINTAIIQKANFRRCINDIIAGRGDLSIEREPLR